MNRYYYEYIARCLSLNAFFSHGLIHSHHVSSTSFVPDLMLPFSSPHVVNRPHSIETYTKGFHGVNHVFHSHAIDDRSFCIIEHNLPADFETREEICQRYLKVQEQSPLQRVLQTSRKVTIPRKDINIGLLSNYCGMVGGVNRLM